jgi:hypothetical protein
MAVMEVLLNLTPLNLLIMAEARMTLYRLHMFMQPADFKTETGLLSTWKNVSDPILDMRSDHTIPVYNYSKLFNVNIHMDYWRNKDPELHKDALNCLLMVSELTYAQGLVSMVQNQTKALALL